MKTRTLISIFASLIFCVGFMLPTFGDELKPIQLPAPKLDHSKPLIQVLKERKTTREVRQWESLASNSFKPSLGRMGNKPARFRQTNRAIRVQSPGH